MHKLIITFLLSLLTSQTYAQVWNGSSTSTQTFDNVSIGTGFTLGTPPYKLNISSGYGINCSSCSIVNSAPGIKIQWMPPDLTCGFCSTGISGILPDILYFYSPSTTLVGGNNTIMRLSGHQQFSIGGDANTYFKSTFHGRSFFNDEVQFKKKVRINSGTIGINDWGTSFPYSFSVDAGDVRFLGKVQIGDLKPNGSFASFKLGVDGDIVCKKMVVEITDWADFVFAAHYDLKPLTKVKEFIELNKCLPNMPNQEDMIRNGLDLSEMQKLQQQKIEELTLYIIQQQEFLDKLSAKIEKFEMENK